MTICDKTFDLVTEHLEAVDYDGPVGLSCDDTKVLGALRLYWDGDKKKHFLVGAVGGPIEVPDPDEIKSLMSDPTIMKGTKVQILLNYLMLFQMQTFLFCRSGFGAYRFLFRRLHPSL